MHEVRYQNKIRRKYGNIKKEYNGIVYHSQKEADYAFELDLRIKAKDIKSWDRQVRIDLKVNGYHICNYYIDFVIHHNDKSLEYVEVKGFVTDLWRMKWKMTEAIFSKDHPEIKLSIVR